MNIEKSIQKVLEIYHSESEAMNNNDDRIEFIAELKHAINSLEEILEGAFYEDEDDEDAESAGQNLSTEVPNLQRSPDDRAGRSA